MSRYAWERGTLTIPSKEWVGLKKAVREAHNRAMERARSVALKAYDRLAKADVNSRQQYDALRHGEDPLRGLFRGLHEDAHSQILRSLFSRQTGRRVKPKKKDFPLANTATKVFHLGEATLAFDNEARQVHWDVPENNHAVERAREYPQAEALFRFLRGIGQRNNWTARSGGEILGNDEYNRHDGEQHAGGGATYVTDSYSKESNRESRPRSRAR